MLYASCGKSFCGDNVNLAASPSESGSANTPRYSSSYCFSVCVFVCCLTVLSCSFTANKRVHYCFSAFLLAMTIPLTSMASTVTQIQTTECTTSVGRHAMHAMRPITQQYCVFFNPHRLKREWLILSSKLSIHNKIVRFC